MEDANFCLSQIDNLQFKEELLKYLIIQLIKERLKLISEAEYQATPTNTFNYMKEQFLRNVIREKSENSGTSELRNKFHKNQKV